MRYRKSISKFIILMLMISGCISCSGQTSKSNDYEVSEENIQNSILYLASDELNGRATGSEGAEKAAEFLEETFESFGLQPYFETYRDSFMVNNLHAYNIVAVSMGSDEKLKNEFILIGAHYDHIGNTATPVAGDTIANGANDNAAGTAGVIEIAREFAQNHNNKRSIIFVLFSGEEKGLKGSQHLAAKLKDQGMNLYAMVNLEMIGVPMKAKDYKAYVTGYENSNLAAKFNAEYSDGKLLGYLPQAAQMNLFERSDNYPFYNEFHIPAQTISTFDFSNYSYYHHVDDEAENLNTAFMRDLIQDLIPPLHVMTNTEMKNVKLNM